MRFLRRFRTVRSRPSLGDELELVYWRTFAEVEPLLRRGERRLAA